MADTPEMQRLKAAHAQAMAAQKSLYERRELFLFAAAKAGYPWQTWPDIVHRGLTEYPQDVALDEGEATRFMAQLKRDAPHLQPPRPSSPTPPEAPAIDWSKLPPAERMTAFREQQATPAQRVQP